MTKGIELLAGCRKDIKKDEESGKYHEFTNEECLVHFNYNYNKFLRKLKKKQCLRP